MRSFPPAPAYAVIADQIETELRVLGVAPSPTPVRPLSGAFGAPTMTFPQWLEHVLCPRLRAVASGASPAPPASHVAAQAARELDGFVGTDALLDALARLDALVGGGGDNPRQG